MGIEGIDAAQFGWQKRAECNLAPSHVFFPEEETKSDRVIEIKSPDGLTYKDFCDRCKVRQICLEFSLLHDMQGIWGGLTDRQRRKRFSSGERDEMREDKYDIGSYKALYGHS